MLAQTDKYCTISLTGGDLIEEYKSDYQRWEIKGCGKRRAKHNQWVLSHTQKITTSRVLLCSAYK